MRNKIIQLLISILVLVGCTPPVTPPPPEVVVRDQAKVLDPATRTALEEFRPDGTLVFAAGAVTAKTGDVMVSQPSTNAPNGLLRKVVQVQTVNGKTVVQTEQAKLGDVLQKGALKVQRELTEADSESITPLVAGSVVQTRGTRALGLSYTLDVVLFDKDGNNSTTNDQVKASGSLNLKPVFDLALSLDCGFLCIYDNDLDFKFAIGLEERASLKLVAKVAFSASKVIPVFTHNFTPITFFIGPVPVVIKPRFTIKIKLDGSIGVDVSFEAVQTFTAVAGVKYDSDWQNISEISNRFETSLGAASVNVNATAKVPLNAEFLLYGVVGPFIELSPKLGFDAAIPRDPVWKLFGGVEGKVGIHVDILGYTKDFSANLFDLTAQIAESTNAAPTIKFLTPSPLDNLSSDVGHNFRVEVSDPEDGSQVCCSVTFSSSVDGALGTATGFQPEVAATFTTLAQRTITATAKDSKGKTSSATVTVNVTNPAPTVAMFSPVTDQQFFRGVSYKVLATSFDANETDAQHNLLGALPCTSLSWTSSVAGDALPVTGCDPRVTFSSNGVRTLTLTGTDARGATATATVSVNVIDPPANLPPVANIAKPANNIFVGPDEVIDILGSATDPEGGAVTLGFDITYPFNVQTGTGTTTQVITVPASGKWKPSDSIDFSGACEWDFFMRLRLHGKDPQSNDGTDFVVLHVNKIC
jgi:hypothetical protein